MLIFGARYPYNSIPKKVKQEAKYKVEKLFCSKTGKRLEDVKTLIKSAVESYSFLGIETDNESKTFNLFAQKHGLDWEYDDANYIGFSMDNNEFTSFERFEEWKEKLEKLELSNIGLYVAYSESSY